MATPIPLTTKTKVTRFLTPAVVLCFLLPFFGISCDGVELITISGTDMVGGCKPGGMLSEMGDDEDRPGRSRGGSMSGKVENVKVEPLAIAAFALALIATGLAWVRTRQALLAACIVAFLGVGVMAGLYIKVMGDMKAAAEKGAKPKEKPPSPDGQINLDLDMESKMKGKVSIDSKFGFWLATLGFIAVGTLTALALKQKQGPPAPETVAPPPPAAAA